MGMKEREEIKQLESIKNGLSAKLEGLRVQRGNIDKEIHSTNQSVNNLMEKIERLKQSGNLIVSEHAIIRYIERVLGINIEEVTNKIVPEEIKKQIEILGNGTYSVDDGEFRIVLKDNVVVTVLKDVKSK